MSNESFHEAAKTVKIFLHSNVPPSDVPNIENEMKKDFVFAKKKARGVCKQKKKKKIKCLTRKEKKMLDFYTLPRNSIKYSDILPMHEMWLDYMHQILDLDKGIPSSTSNNWENFIQSLYKADFHGSLMEVVRSKCPSYVGMKGLCVLDTKNTFKIVSNCNIVTTIPKKDCVFDIFLNNMKIMLFGKHLCVRPAERSNKKVKMLQIPDL